MIENNGCNNRNIREIRFLSNAFRWNLVGTEETWAIYRNVQLISGSAESGGGGADNADIIASQVGRYQLNSRRHLSLARATTALYFEAIKAD